MSELSFERLRVAVSGGVMTVTVSRPKARNALDIATIRELRDLARELPVLGDIAVVLLASEGQDTFIAGGDLREFAKLKGERAGHALSESMAEVTCLFEDLPQVVVAAVDGDAYGGGVELALACDLRIMKRSSRLHFAQGRFGLTTAWGGTVRLVRLVGYSRALDILLSMKTLDAAASLDLGLANRVIDDDDFATEMPAVVQAIADIGRELVWGMKRVARAAVTSPPGDAMLVERGIFAKLWAGQTHEAKVAKFMESRAWVSRPDPE
jgi:enoyl-CoA hydratase